MWELLIWWKTKLRNKTYQRDFILKPEKGLSSKHSPCCIAMIFVYSRLKHSIFVLHILQMNHFFFDSVFMSPICLDVTQFFSFYFLLCWTSHLNDVTEFSTVLLEMCSSNFLKLDIWSISRFCSLNFWLATPLNKNQISGLFFQNIFWLMKFFALFYRNRCFKMKLIRVFGLLKVNLP